VGAAVGAGVGGAVGVAVGGAVGAAVGVAVGAAVGVAVGAALEHAAIRSAAAKGEMTARFLCIGAWWVLAAGKSRRQVTGTVLTANPPCIALCGGADAAGPPTDPV
jgi:hypothetical protein